MIIVVTPSLEYYLGSYLGLGFILFRICSRVCLLVKKAFGSSCVKEVNLLRVYSCGLVLILVIRRIGLLYKGSKESLLGVILSFI